MATPVTLRADHTGSVSALLLKALGLDVMGEAKSSTLPALVRPAMSTPEAS